MDSLIDVDIAIVAWPNHPQRWRAVCDTIYSLKDNLTAAGCRLHWHCSSESDRDPNHAWYGDALTERCAVEGIRLSFRDGPAGLGENMNAALRMCKHDYILLVQDDRPLIAPLDLRPSIDYLRDHADVALIRYDWPHGKNKQTGAIRTPMKPLDDYWQEIDRSGPWYYGDEPHLRRRDFMDEYGWYIENVIHGRSEVEMKSRLRRCGARIVAPHTACFGHRYGNVSAVINDIRPGGGNR